MRIVIATGNKGKLQEIKELLPHFEVVSYSDIMEPFEIIEDGNSFKENAIIKAKAVYNALNDRGSIVLSDDSGISVPLLGGEPGIYSARYAGIHASDKENLERLILELKKRGVTKAEAFYTCAIAIAAGDRVLTTHGFMYGDVLDTARGDKGFGYDPMFVPKGFDMTLGELDNEIKKGFSHRSRALELAKSLLELVDITKGRLSRK